MKTGKMSAMKWIIGLAMGAFLIYMGFRLWTKLAAGQPVSTGDLVSILVALTSLAQFATWGFDSKAQRDEMGQLISAKSAKLSYYLLVIALFLLWIVDRIVFLRKEDLGNATLFFALCLSLVLHPIVEFFHARRYK